MLKLCDVFAHRACNDIILHLYRQVAHAQRRRHGLLHVDTLATSPRGYRELTTVLVDRASPHTAPSLGPSILLQSCPCAARTRVSQPGSPQRAASSRSFRARARLFFHQPPRLRPQQAGRVTRVTESGRQTALGHFFKMHSGALSGYMSMYGVVQY